MTNHIQKRAMLVNLSISSWSASKKDSTASRATKASAGAADKAGWFNKRLIDPVALEPINQIEGRARSYHYKMTLLWSDQGDRLLPGALFTEYTANIRALRNEFDAAVEKFIAAYPQCVTDARGMLGSMYNPADYPTVQVLRERFAIRVSFSAVPDADDFRVEVGEAAIAEVRASMNEALNERLSNATKECWSRLYEVVMAMHVALMDPKRRFHDSLVTNIESVVKLLPAMNLMNDKKLDAMCERVKDHLIVDPRVLRQDLYRRAVFAEFAGKFALEIEPWMMNSTKAA